MFRAGEGMADISPPMGIELAGFHRPAGEERLVRGIRKPAAVRALVLEKGGQRVALLSVDILAVSRSFSGALARAIEAESGIPESQVRICATHTHSMPTFTYLRLWGAISEPYMRQVHQAAVDAVGKAVEDLAEADLYLGAETVRGGNFNRTVPTWKTEEDWSVEASDSERWLDRRLHSLYFLRANGKPSLRWYHFSAHPVCYDDDQAGPDWPGLVAERFGGHDRTPVFLQGHIGDVNPGDGTPWRGDAEKTANAVSAALHHAVGHGEWVDVDTLRMVQGEARVTFDLDRLRAELAAYEELSEEELHGVWVNPAFAKAWHEDLSGWDMSKDSYTTPISALRLGNLAIFFHAAELYSFYGLQLRHQSPFPDTLAVGYAEDFAGYLTDPAAYDEKEYAAIVVPKITGLPPFQPEAARDFTEQSLELLRTLA